MIGSAITLERDLSGPVYQYSLRHHLLPHLQTALGLAESHFSPIQNLDVSVDTDPETDEEKLVIDITLAMEIDDVLGRKQAYTRDWINAAPLSAHREDLPSLRYCVS